MREEGTLFPDTLSQDPTITHTLSIENLEIKGGGGGGGGGR